MPFWLIEELRELAGVIIVVGVVALLAMGSYYRRVALTPLCRTRPRNAPHVERAAAGNAPHVKAMVAGAGRAAIAPPVVRTSLTPSEREAAKAVALLAAIGVGIVLIVALKVWVL